MIAEQRGAPALQRPEMQASGEANQMRYQNKTRPLVSIIIPYYKQEEFIVETVWSAKRLTYPYVEIVVVDDGSPSPVEPLLKGFAGLKLIRTENRGCPAARNAGFAVTSGEYVIFLDADDRLHRGAIEAHLEAFARAPQAVLSFGAVRRIDEDGKEIRAAHVCRPRKNYFQMLLGSNPISCPGAALIRRDAFVTAGMFDETFLLVEDYRLYLTLAKRYHFVRHDQCVVDYRFHASSGSRNTERMFEATMAALDRLESEHSFTASEHRAVQHGRRRWAYSYYPPATLIHKIRSLCFNFQGMLGVPVNSYFRKRRRL